MVEQIKLTREAVVKCIMDMKEKSGDYPTRDQWAIDGICDIKTLTRKYGRWSSLLLEIFGDDYKAKYVREECCLECGKVFEVNRTAERKFCSSSCSASFNNKYIPKRHKTKKCKICKTLIGGSQTYCKKCFQEGKHQKDNKIIAERTIREVSKYPGMAMYNVIRSHARTITKNRPYKCVKCGYNKYVQTCHIKPIKSFDPDALVKVVNAEDNLILLCPNCHWEFDHMKKDGVPLARLELASAD